jgi:transcriptional regulator with XRE-family HTH domain
MMGIHLRETREERSLSYQQVSELTDISPARIRQIENGEFVLRDTTIQKLVATLDLEQGRIDKIIRIAKISFVRELMKLIWFQPQDGEEFDAKPS